ncbi:MAG: methylmalonyl-CoA epimerase [Acidobacteria bacterium]|nr:methylmalonyl-CoA epimerase [Acidobacteriota bacterium]
MLKKLRHIGIMVDDFQGALEKFKGFGLTCSETREDKPLDLLIGFLSIGDTSIELLHHTKPFTGGDAVSGVVRGQKGAINHLCFEVDDLDASIRDFEKNGARMIEGCPRKGAHGRIAFFHPETTAGVLIELCEL